MFERLEQFQLAVGTFREHGRAERLHDLLYGDIGAGQLVLGGTVVDGGAKRDIRACVGWQDRRVARRSF